MFPYVQKVYDPLLSSTAGIQYLLQEDLYLSARLTPDASPADETNDFVLKDSSESFFHLEKDPIEELFPELLGLKKGVEALPNAGDLTNEPPHNIISGDFGIPSMTLDLYTPESIIEVEVETENEPHISSDSGVPDTFHIEIGPPTLEVAVEIEVETEHKMPFNREEIALPLKQKPVKRSRGRPRCKTDKKQVSKLYTVCGQLAPTYASTTYASSTQFGERAKRVRGRPRGKPPKLNLQERRERNAELERERRAKLGDYYELLRLALGGNPDSCDIHADELSREELLVEAIKALQMPPPEVQIAELRRQNSLLKMRIERLQGEG